MIEKEKPKRQRTPTWFRIAVWGGMALFVLIALVIGAAGENTLRGAG